MVIEKIPNQIIKEPLQNINLSKIDSIALHHMAHPTADIKTIESWHIAQGWRAIGYNFWVAFDGTIYEGRGFHLGAGVENQNDHIISIGFQGDYNKNNKMPDTQFNAGIEIIKYIMNKIPTIRKIGGHWDFMETECPGKHFPLGELKSLKKRNEELSMTQYEELKKEIQNLKKTEYNWLKECPEWSKPYIQKALDLKILKGNEKGELHLTDDKIFSLVTSMRIGGLID